MPTSDPTIASFFAAAAEGYEQCIVPAFRYFAETVVELVGVQPRARVLDVGTGTGVVARLLAPQVGAVVGVDIAAEMVAAAGATLANDPRRNIRFMVGDAHALPFADDAFDMVVSSLGLNATAPERVFFELHRVLRPGGMLAFLEWGSITHRFDEAIQSVLSCFRLSEASAPPDLKQVRRAMQVMCRWEEGMKSGDDFRFRLADAGFSKIEVTEDRPVDCVLSLSAFLDYKFAWTHNRAELEALGPLRTDCVEAVRAVLAREADCQGHLHYDPVMFRVRAIA